MMEKKVIFLRNFMDFEIFKISFEISKNLLAHTSTSR